MPRKLETENSSRSRSDLGGANRPNLMIYTPVLDTRPAFRYEFAGPGSRSGAILTNPPVLGLRPASVTLAPALARSGPARSPRMRRP